MKTRLLETYNTNDNGCWYEGIKHSIPEDTADRLVRLARERRNFWNRVSPRLLARATVEARP